MLSLSQFIDEALINRNTKLKTNIGFDEFINMIKSSKNNRYIDSFNSFKNVDELQVDNWYKWDILKNTYVFIIRKFANHYRAIAVQENQKNKNYISIYMVNISEDFKKDYNLYYHDCFFKNSMVNVIIKNDEWVNEFLKLLDAFVENYYDNIRLSSDFKDFEENFLTDEYLIFK